MTHKAHLKNSLRTSFIFLSRQNKSLDFLGIETPQLHKNLRSSEVASSNNATRNSAENNLSPSEARPVILKVEESAEAHRSPTSERDAETNRLSIKKYEGEHNHKVEDGDTALYTNKAESTVTPNNSNEEELHLKEEDQGSNQVPKALQSESGEEKCQHDGEYHLNGQSVGYLLVQMFKFSFSISP